MDSTALIGIIRLIRFDKLEALEDISLSGNKVCPSLPLSLSLYLFLSLSISSSLPLSFSLSLSVCVCVTCQEKCGI